MGADKKEAYMGHLPTVIAATLQNTPNLLALAAAVAVLLLWAVPLIRAERRRAAERREARRREREIQADVDTARERSGMLSALGQAVESARNETADR